MSDRWYKVHITSILALGRYYITTQEPMCVAFTDKLSRYLLTKKTNVSVCFQTLISLYVSYLTLCTWY